MNQKSKEKTNKTSVKKLGFVGKRKSSFETLSFDNTILAEGTNFNIIEAYKDLRTNILFTSRGTGCRKFVVTSSFPSEGKTTNSVNIAITFAQTGKKVLLVDGDLRKPKIHKLFNLSNKVGLSNVLSNVFDDDNHEFVHKNIRENLDVVTSGHIPPNPMELLSSDAMEAFVSEYESKYDFIIIDTPPVNVVSDSLVLSSFVTGYLLVVRANYTEFQALDMTMAKFEIANIKPLGIILNGVAEVTNTYKYKKKYKYTDTYISYRAGR